jgi:orotate phosphoribosyltransferase
VALTEEDVLGILRHTGALRTGHFVLSSGRHSDTYVEKARVFEHPDVTVRLGREIASWYEDVVAVVSPAVGAIPLGFATALAAGARFVYAEREGGTMALRRGFAIAPGERVVIVEDVVTTGESAAEVLALARDRGARVLGVAALVDRAGPRAGLPLRALSRVSAQTWDPDACPLCARDVPAESPGSRHLAEKRRSFG